MRICSFLPSATEILYALGLGEAVAGVTYECDHPPEARTKRVVVHTRLNHSTTAGETDRQVREFIERGESLYRVDLEALREITPDLIVTQDLCHVCAASPDDLAAALATLPRAPQVLTLTPRMLTEVWNDIQKVGEATGRTAEAQALVTHLEARVEAVRQAVAGRPRPRALCLEWLDPPYCAGHWVPEMAAIAGGTDVMGRVGEPSFRVTWEEALATQPEVILLMPCGYGLAQVVEEFKSMRLPAGWNQLPAVRRGHVFAVDANSYFSRPGPRLADGVEMLAHLFHTERLPAAPSAFFRM